MTHRISFRNTTRRLTHRIWAGAAVAAPLLYVAMLAGCERAESQPAPPPPPSVTVAKALQGEVTDWAEFTGRFEAVDRVELRPRVSGYIESVRFQEGAEVKKGDVLFVIDPRPYKAALDRAEGELARIKAQAAYADSESHRAERLLSSKAISQGEHDSRVSQNSQSQADVRSAQAAVDAARLNLEFTRVISPIAGRVSRAVVTEGNYVSAGSNVLTSVVSLDPIYVSFDGDEQSYLNFRPKVGGDSANSAVFVGLANEEGYPHTGRLNFLDNALNPATGTIRVRALLANPDRQFTPGLFARVRIPGSERYSTTLIPEAAIATDQDRRYVLVVDGAGTVEYRTVQLGGVHEGKRVVRDGLKPGEQVVVSGLQRARPGSKVTPQSADQPAQASNNGPAKS
jgi:RND family efflux transporter MFP subunit